MGTKVRKRRSSTDISRLSTQTRLTAWTIYVELIRDGLDPDVAIRKALQEACPPKDDPYYRSFYPNKMRELELWRKHSLWPLSNPKDIEHDTGPHTMLEGSGDVTNRVHGTEESSSDFTLLLDNEDPDDEDRIDTLEFDPVEVAKIIDSYEHAPTLTAAEAIETLHASIQGGMKPSFVEDPYTDRSARLEIGTPESVGLACLREIEGDTAVWDSSNGCRSVPSVSSDQADVGAAQATGLDPRRFMEVDQHTLNELLVMLAWWKDNKGRLSRPEALVGRRPHFAHSRLKTKRIRMNDTLWEDAEKVAKRQTEISGGTLSGLLEYLLWRHLGSPEKHLKK